MHGQSLERKTISIFMKRKVPNVPQPRPSPNYLNLDITQKVPAPWQWVALQTIAKYESEAKTISTISTEPSFTAHEYPKCQM